MFETVGIPLWAFYALPAAGCFVGVVIVAVCAMAGRSADQEEIDMLHADLAATRQREAEYDHQAFAHQCATQNTPWRKR